MKTAAKFFLLPILVMLVTKANANVQWNEPEVIPQKLTRKNRRVLRFSGKTRAEAPIRIKRNSLKLFLDSGQSRWAKIPKKDRTQFPVYAGGDGRFSFNLYLPTVAVEIPIEIKIDGKWRPYTLNFRVPDEGQANEFSAMEESFQAQDNTVSRIDQDENYYSRKHDQGMMIRGRDGKMRRKRSRLHAWLGLGISYFSTSADTPGVFDNTTGSTLVIPTWRLGGSWDFSRKLRVVGALRSTSGSTDDIGNADTNGRDFSWLEAQVGAIYFAEALRFRGMKFGLDVGFQMQSLPYFRLREGGGVFLNQSSYFDNSLYNLHVGLFFEKYSRRSFDYEFYARYLYPFSSGDAFTIESSFPIMFEFGGGVKRDLTQSLTFGIFGQLNYFAMDTTYSSSSQAPLSSDYSAMLFTIDARLITSF